MNANDLSIMLEFPDWMIDGIGSTAWSVFGPAATVFDAQLTAAFPGLNTKVDELTPLHKMSVSFPLTGVSSALFTILAYFVVITVLYPVSQLLGKQKCRAIGLVHNFFLFALSLYMCVAIITTAVAADYSLWNNPVGTRPIDYRMAKLMWLFYVSKVPEFVDTFIMILKQNYRQVSFLHVYHHVTIFLINYICVRFAPGGDAYFSAAMNSGIHVVMYGYYFFTMIFEKGPMRSFLNKFKFVITKGQMTQFALNMCQSIYDLYIVPAKQVKFSRPLMSLLFWYMLSLLFLFYNFLRKNMKEKKAEDEAEQLKNSAPNNDTVVDNKIKKS